MKRIYFLLLFALCSTVGMAQDGSASVSVTKTSHSSTATASIPWLWIVIGVVVLILVVALISGGRDRIIHKRTVIRE